MRENISDLPFTVNGLSAISASMIAACLIQPIENAQKRATRTALPFFNSANFKNPYGTAHISAIQRGLAGSIYFFSLGELKKNLTPALRERGFQQHHCNYINGTLAGIFSGTTTHFLTHAKNIMRENNAGFLSSVARLTQDRDPRFIISAGLNATQKRDAVFAFIYESLRKDLYEHFKQSIHPTLAYVVANACGAGAGALASSPFNHVRFQQLNTPRGEKPWGTIKILTQLAKDANSRHGLEKFNFLERTLRIRMNAPCIMLRMALTQGVFDLLLTAFKSSSPRRHFTK